MRALVYHKVHVMHNFKTNRYIISMSLPVHVCVCVCVISFYDDKVMGTRITLSQLDAAAPESLKLCIDMACRV